MTEEEIKKRLIEECVAEGEGLIQCISPERAAEIMGITTSLLDHWRVSGGGPSFTVFMIDKEEELIRYPLGGDNGLMQYMKSRTQNNIIKTEKPVKKVKLLERLKALFTK